MSTYSTSSIPQGIAIYANATLFPVTAIDGEQAVAADTNTLYIYDTSVPGWQAVANPGAAIAIDALTGEVTATGPGVVAATITNAAVTNAKLAAMADNTVKGNKSGAPASPSDLALSDVAEATSSVLTITNGSKAIVGAANLTIQVLQSSALQSGYLSSADWSTFNSKQPAGNYITDLTGEVTATGPGSVAATIAANAVTNAKLAQMATLTIKGNNTGGPSDPLDLTTAQTTAILDVMVGDSGAGGTKGLVPAPVTGDATKYLRGDATWQTISLLPAYSQDKVLYSTASAAEWRTVGTGSSDSTYPTGCVILGTTKPSFTGNGGQYSLIAGSGSGSALTSATPVTLLNGGNNLTTGVHNVLVGNLGNAITNGNYNVVIGSDLYAGSQPNPTGLSNAVLIGSRAFAYGGSQQVIIGYQTVATDMGIAIGFQAKAGDLNYGAQRDVAIGWQALCYEGSDCISIGYTAYSRGPNQIVIGSGAAAGGTTGTNASDGIIIGKGSGKTTITGNNNTVVGSGSFNNASLTTAANNTIVGQGSATAITIANDNLIAGVAAGVTIATGNANVILGKNADCSLSNNFGTVAVGYSAKVGGTEAIAVGYGAYAKGVSVITIGGEAGNSSDNGNSFSTYIGYGAGFNGTKSGVYVTTLGAYTAANLTSAANCVFLGAHAGRRSTTQSNELFIDNQDRSTYSDQQTKSLIYGVFNATETSQTLRLNAQTQLAYGEKHASLHGQVGTANVITATVNNYYIGVDTSAAAKTVNLPAAATAGQGFVLVIKDESGTAGTNNITLQASGAETIDGTNTKLIAANYGSYSLMCSGSAWFIM